uniref:Uncharacterized protein n=1 Tax=Acrobeloides nanus TaxID=290746 RepID=A0A914C353_9BILA
MGGGNSRYEHPTASLEQQSYPDLNMIVKGIPKMMQVADDMHRMTNYMGDLRNMTLAMGVMSAIGIMLFLLLKYVHSSRKKRRNRQRLYHHSGDYSDHSSLNRPIRQYAQKDVGWSTPTHKIDMEKFVDHQVNHNQAPPPPPKPQRETTDFSSPSNIMNQPNGGHMIKTRYDPVKLAVEELPYVDS